MTSNISQPGLRAALVRAQGVCTSAADEDRIQRVTDGISDGLAQIAGHSLFDTEPAHFERNLISRAAAGTISKRAVS